MPPTPRYRSANFDAGPPSRAPAYTRGTRCERRRETVFGSDAEAVWASEKGATYGRLALTAVMEVELRLMAQVEPTLTGPAGH